LQRWEHLERLEQQRFENGECPPDGLLVVRDERKKSTLTASSQPLDDISGQVGFTCLPSAHMLGVGDRLDLPAPGIPFSQRQRTVLSTGFSHPVKRSCLSSHAPDPLDVS